MTSDIEWLLGPDGRKGFAWNALLGCSPQSPGCLHCYAATLASRGMCEEHVGLTRKVKRRNATGKLVSLAVYNGVVRLHPERLLEPLRRKAGKRVFVNSMSDLFHDEVPFDYIAAVYAVMILADHHTYLALTKNPARAVAFFDWLLEDGLTGLYHRINDAARTWIPGFEGRAVYPTQRHGMVPDRPWPPTQVQLGVSAENQPLFDLRVPQILQCPASVHWVSIEPQLGPIDVARHVFDRRAAISHLVNGPACLNREQADDVVAYPLHWVVIGGESGPGARPFDVVWARSIVDECALSNTPCFVKQIGSNPLDDGKKLVLPDGKGADWNGWTGDLGLLRQREIIHGAQMKRYRFAS